MNKNEMIRLRKRACKVYGDAGNDIGRWTFYHNYDTENSYVLQALDTSDLHNQGNPFFDTKKQATKELIGRMKKARTETNLRITKAINKLLDKAQK